MVGGGWVKRETVLENSWSENTVQHFLKWGAEIQACFVLFS